MLPKFIKHCPVCGARDCTPDIDYPNTMEECTACLAEWNIDGELILDSRIGLSEGEVLQKGWFIDVIN